MDEESTTSEADRLGNEIASLKEQVAAAQKQLKSEASTIVSSTACQDLLKSPSSFSSQTSIVKLLGRAEQQEAHIQQCYYRICTPITTFKVHDPDPNAVDGGHVLGLRFEVMSRSQFLRPYYVMLNRPYFNSTCLRVHRNTLPPAIPLAGLAARHLAPPRPESDNSPKQDLDRFVRTLRREIMRYHNRLGVSADLRRSLVLHDKDKELQVNDVIEVGIADIEAKQIKLTWADERSGRLVMDDDGKVVKLVIFGNEGHDWETTKELFAEHQRIEDVVKKLQDYAAGSS